MHGEQYGSRRRVRQSCRSRADTGRVSNNSERSVRRNACNERTLGCETFVCAAVIAVGVALRFVYVESLQKLRPVLAEYI